MAMRKAETLPEELIIEILSWLPAKFIGQCRCLSKQWFNFLSDPQFIKLHLTVHAHKEDEEEEKQVICISSSKYLQTITFNPQNGRDGVSRKLNFQHLSDNWACIFGSCNGLVLVGNEENIQFIINPRTLKYHTIPNFQLALPADQSSFSMSGLGYDVTTEDYKVVTLSQYDDTYDNECIFVDVYSVRKGLWRRLECLPHYAVEKPNYVVFLNGALHWLAVKISDHSLVIVAFDLSGEKFFEVPAPPTPDKGNLEFSRLVVCRGRLCMFNCTISDQLYIWTMREYGVEKSWTNISSTVLLFDMPLNSMREEGASTNASEGLVVGMKEEQCCSTPVAGTRGAVAFMESLVNPTFSNGT